VEDKPWVVKGETKGMVRSYGAYTFLQVGSSSSSSNSSSSSRLLLLLGGDQGDGEVIWCLHRPTGEEE